MSHPRFIAPEVLAEIKDAITADPIPLAERYVPPGLIRQRDRGNRVHWRAKSNKGDQGGFKVTRDGGAGGPLLSDFTTGTYGRGIHFIERREGCGWLEAALIAAEIYGISTGINATPDPEAEARREQRQAEQQADNAARAIEAEQTEQEAIEDARALAAEALPITPGDPADRYLTHWRGIARPATGWPASVRFLPSAPGRPRDALLIVATDNTDAVVAVQRIKLDPNAPKGREAGKLAKISTGRPSQGFVRLPGAPTNTDFPGNAVALAEGAETGLSIWAATGLPVLVSIGTRTIEQIAPGALAILCRDDDAPTLANGKPHPAYVMAEGNRDRLRASGHVAVDAWPWPSRRHDKSDFNDTLKAEGGKAIRALVRDALASLPPPLPPIDKARETVADILADWIPANTAQNRNEGATLLLRAGVGIGKTQAALAEAIKLDAIRAERQAAMIANPDDDSIEQIGPIVIAVPDHGLAEQMARDVDGMLGKDRRVRVWRGREQDGMCANIEPIRDMIAAALPCAPYCFEQCPMREGCAYLGQMKATADVWIVTHALLFLAKPQTIGAPSLLIVDERFWTNAISGHDGAPRTVSSLRLPDAYRSRYEGQRSNEVWDRITRLGDVLARAASRAPDTGEPVPVLASDFDALSFTPESLRDGIRQTQEVCGWFLRDGSDMKNVRRFAATRRGLLHACSVLRAAAEAMEAGATEIARLVVMRDQDGTPHYRRLSRKHIAEGWSAPTLLLDATANPDTVRLFFLDVEAPPPIEAETPHARHVWVRGETWGARAQREATKRAEDDLAKGDTPNHRGAGPEGLRLRQWDRYRQSGGGGLAVCNKALADFFRNHVGEPAGHLPPRHNAEHFNTLKGRNDWQADSTVSTYGRPLPALGDIELAAVALTGRALTIPTACPEIETGERNGVPFRRLSLVRESRTLPTGQVIGAERYRHPDLIADAILTETVEAELVQDAGRARAVNRTADNPVTIYIHGDTYPAGLPLDAIEASKTPGPAVRMFGSGGGGSAGTGGMPILYSAADAARAYPGLWGSLKKAELSFSREKHIPSQALRDIFKACEGMWNGASSLKARGHLWADIAPVLSGLGFSPALFRVCQYQPEGPRQRPRLAIVPHGMASGFADWIGSAIGARVRVVWLGGDHPEPPTPPRPDRRREDRGPSAGLPNRRRLPDPTPLPYPLRPAVLSDGAHDGNLVPLPPTSDSGSCGVIVGLSRDCRVGAIESEAVKAILATVPATVSSGKEQAVPAVSSAVLSGEDCPGLAVSNADSSQPEGAKIFFSAPVLKEQTAPSRERAGWSGPGAIDRDCWGASLPNEARMTGHAMGAEDESHDPGLAWIFGVRGSGLPPPTLAARLWASLSEPLFPSDRTPSEKPL